MPDNANVILAWWRHTVTETNE